MSERQGDILSGGQVACFNGYMESTSNTATLDPASDKGKPTRRRELTECLCGCGDMVPGRYRPGHDARHVSYLVKATLGAKGSAKAKIKREVASLSDKLQAKYEKSLARAEAAAVKPANADD